MLRQLLCFSLTFCLAISTPAQLNNPHADHGPQKTRYAVFISTPKTLDPAKAYTSDASSFISQIYEPPLQYHYLLRPYQLIPLTTTRMPSIEYVDKQFQPVTNNKDLHSVAYTIYTINLQPNILYQPHPAFAKQGDHYLYLNLSNKQLNNKNSLGDFKKTGSLELTADDYIYEIKRLADPRLNSPIFGLMQKYILGLTELRKTLQEIIQSKNISADTDYFLDMRQHTLAGVRKVNKYQYQIIIKGIYPQFTYWLAMNFFAPIPWQVDKFYSQPGMKDKNMTLDWYPVGTGPYILSENNPNKQMVLIKNINFHGEEFPTVGEVGDKNKGLLQRAGQALPMIDRFVFTLDKESIPRWNKFLQGYYDKSGVGSDSFDQAIKIDSDGNPQLTETMKKKGIRLDTAISPSIYYTGFNMNDPIVGGYSEKAQALRQAISIAINYEEYIQLFMNGRGVIAHDPIPPSIAGSASPSNYNPYVYQKIGHQVQRKSLAVAKTLMIKAGYPNGIDPTTGKHLVLHYDTTGDSSGESKAQFNWMRKQFAQLGIALNIRATDYNRFQDKIRTGQIQLYTAGWLADYPDAENFLFLLYGPNGKVKQGGENASNYANPTFDKLYAKMQTLQPGPERQIIIKQMLDIARKDAPWIWGTHSVDFILSHVWNNPDKINTIANNTLKYQSIDPKLRHKMQAQWNSPVLWPLLLLTALIALLLAPLAFFYYKKQNKPTLDKF